MSDVETQACFGNAAIRPDNWFVTFTFDHPLNVASGIFSVDPMVEGGPWEWQDEGRVLSFSEGYPTDSDVIFGVFAEDTQHIPMGCRLSAVRVYH